MAKELCMTIPCEPGKEGEHLKGPIYQFDGTNSLEAYRCPHCGRTGPRRKPMERHMGLVMNIPAGCPVLKGEDIRRRKESAKWMEEERVTAMQKDTEELSDALFQMREREKFNRQDYIVPGAERH